MNVKLEEINTRVIIIALQTKCPGDVGKLSHCKKVSFKLQVNISLQTECVLGTLGNHRTANALSWKLWVNISLQTECEPLTG